MISGIDLNETIDFVSQFDKGEPKTIFKISPITAKVRAKIGRVIGTDGAGALDGMVDAFRFGVKGITNLSIKNVPVQFEVERVNIDNQMFNAVANKVVDILPMKVISEVGAKVLTISTMSEEEEKN
jgi:hypothetical protein